MSHHSGNNFYDKDTHDFFKNLKLGATGRFPDGKLDANDEGDLRITPFSTLQPQRIKT